MELRNWYLKKGDNCFYLVGNIYRDDHRRFENGKLIQTSYLKSIDFENMKAYTKNSIYDLEKGDNQDD